MNNQNTLNPLQLIKVETGDEAFSDFLKVAFSPQQPITSARILAGLSDFRVLTTLPALTFDASTGGIQVNLTIEKWNAFFKESFSEKAVGQYVVDLDKDNNGLSYVLYGNDAFLAEYREVLEPVELTGTEPLDDCDDSNCLFDVFTDVDYINSEILAGSAQVDNIELGLPAGF